MGVCWICISITRNVRFGLPAPVQYIPRQHALIPFQVRHDEAHGRGTIPRSGTPLWPRPAASFANRPPTGTKPARAQTVEAERMLPSQIKLVLSALRTSARKEPRSSGKQGCNCKNDKLRPAHPEGQPNTEAGPYGRKRERRRKSKNRRFAPTAPKNEESQAD